MTFLAKSWFASSASSRSVVVVFVGTYWLMILSISLFWSAWSKAPAARTTLPVISIHIDEGLPALPDLSSFAAMAVILPEGSKVDAVLHVRTSADGLEVDHEVESVSDRIRHTRFDGPSVILQGMADDEHDRRARSVAADIGSEIVRTWRTEAVAAWKVPAWLKTPTRYVSEDDPPEKPAEKETSPPAKATAEVVAENERKGRDLVELASSKASEWGGSILSGLFALRAVAAGVGAANAVAFVMLTARRQGQYEALLSTDVDTRHLIMGNLALLLVAVFGAGALTATGLVAWSFVSETFKDARGAGEWLGIAYDALKLSLVASGVATFAMPIVLLAQMKPRRRRTKIMASFVASAVFFVALSMPVVAIHLSESFGFAVGLACMMMDDGWIRFCLCSALPFVGWLPLSGFAAWVADVSHDGAGALVSLLMGIPLTVATYRYSTRFLRRPDMVAEA